MLVNFIFLMGSKSVFILEKGCPEEKFEKRCYSLFKIRTFDIAHNHTNSHDTRLPIAINDRGPSPLPSLSIMPITMCLTIIFFNSPLKILPPVDFVKYLDGGGGDTTKEIKEIPRVCDTNVGQNVNDISIIS